MICTYGHMLIVCMMCNCCILTHMTYVHTSIKHMCLCMYVFHKHTYIYAHNMQTHNRHTHMMHTRVFTHIQDTPQKACMVKPTSTPLQRRRAVSFWVRTDAHCRRVLQRGRHRAALHPVAQGQVPRPGSTPPSCPTPTPPTNHPPQPPSPPHKARADKEVNPNSLF